MVMIQARALRLPLIVGAVLLLVSCGGDPRESEAGAAEGPSAATEAAGGSDADAAATATASPAPVPGFTALDPSCPFPYRLQYPEAWTVEREPYPSAVAFEAGPAQTLTLKILAEEGSAYKEGMSRSFEASGQAEKLREITVGGKQVPVYRGTELGRRNSRTYLLWTPVAELGDAVMWHRLQVVTLSDSEETIRTETVLRILETLERQEC